ncbi:TAXI family TRAP transporter solute-binding subunit [Aliamphritea spongicola]|uniref:TAXI family TRAP transporter solute-binding subunit n=1 Tax=Aliamphritea spongicola TaxID=707589 RepID=UPI00196A79EF|nr:TAXI family TRAP transporter solute-binding subunit [Aliamphritea spongicola]MBN3562068.1 TAXI family TRAP transporter solute-binding subunit [Aliamphritea spongicola]
MKYWWQSCLLLLCGAMFSLPGAAQSNIVSLGTGGVTGLYYPAGGALCRLVNRTRSEHGLHCVVLSTPGSVNNLQKVSNGELDLGIAEAGQLYDALHGRGKFQEADTELRALFSLYPEYISVLVRSDSGIEQFADLLGKRINIGQETSSQQITFGALIKARGWQLEDFAEVHRLAPAEQARALCENRIDATLYVVGHPSGAIKEAVRDCDSKLISLSPADIKALTANNPHYYPQMLNTELYGLTEGVQTAGVNATMFTRADASEEAVYAVVKALFSQFERFQRMHPAFTGLDIKQMVTAPLAAPMHPGAVRYFREAGLL